MEQEVRRLKRLFKDPNPLFTAWLTEWREEADKKDSKMKFVYGVALKSLRQYPLPLTSGKSCNILKGFGVTLCARLDERLQQHIDEHGPLPAIGIEDQVEIVRQKPKAPARKRTPKPKPAASAPEPEPQPAETPPDGSPPRKGGRKSGEYRPKPGSGGFALLVALRRHEQKIATPGGSLRKTALQEAAQPLCNASMTLPDAGGYYTAWSTMSTLVKRKLVLREGNPARFSLTAAGQEVADRLESSPWSVPSRRDCFDRLGGVASPPDRSPDRPSLYGGGTGATGAAQMDRRGSDFGTGAFSVPYAPAASAPTTTSAPAAAAGAAFSYQYVSESGGAVSHKDDALVSLSGGNVGFLVRCRPAALRASGRTYWQDDSRPERDGLVHVYLADSDCAEVCPGLESLPGSATLPRGVTGPTTSASAPVRQSAAAARAAPVRHGRLHEMSDSDSEDEPMITAQTPPQSQRVSQSRLTSSSQSPPQSQSLSSSQSASQSQSRSQSQRRPLPVGASLKRQPTDWSAALKRLRADSQAETCPSANASTPSSAASVASSSSRGAMSSAATAHDLSDEDCHLLSDDDDEQQQQQQQPQQHQHYHPQHDDDGKQRPHDDEDDDSDDDVIITVADIPVPPRQPTVEDEFGGVPFTQSVRPPVSLSPVALADGRSGSVAGSGTTASASGRLESTGSVSSTLSGTRPCGTSTEATGGSPSASAAAVLMRERAAAAAEARLGRRPHLSSSLTTTQGAAGSPADRPVVPSSTSYRPTYPDDACRSSSSLAATAAKTAAVPVVSSYRPASKPPAPSLPARPPTDTLDFTPSVVLQPGTFDVMLCVDNQETSGKSGPGACLRTYRDVVLAELQKNGVVADVRKLSVGDFLWVARSRVGSQPEELVLPYIVERKRLDDLASSIRDSRYREQKFRLKRCGVPNVIYLAEAMGTGPRAKAVGLPEATLQQALANCQVVDGFRVKWTADQRETAAFLTLMTRRLQRRYQYRQLEGYPRELLPTSPLPVGQPERLQLFSEFHQLSAKRKRLTVTDAFAKMLLQLSGLSVDKAAAIVAAYPTPAGLVEAYGRCGSKAEGEALLAGLRAERSGRPVGAAVSKAVYHLYCDPQLA